METFLQNIAPTINGYLMLETLFPGKFSIPVPAPQHDLDGPAREVLHTVLVSLIPKDNLIVDLWEQDCRFEKDLGEEWFYNAAFGTQGMVAELAMGLGEFFLDKVAEYRMDYDQRAAPEHFLAWISESSLTLILEWRSNIAQHLHSELGEEGMADEEADEESSVG
jgi:hypothetical protein